MYARLNDAEFALVRDHSKALLAGFDRDGFAFHLERDMEAWGAEVERYKPSDRPRNPTFDPTRCFLEPTNSFGLVVRVEGRLVACHAVRLFVTNDFMEEVRTQRLWVSRDPAALAAIDSLVVPDGVPIMRERVIHQGATWVDPAWRRQGLASRLNVLARGLALLEWSAEWFNGIAFDFVVQSEILRTCYQYSSIVPLIDGYFPAIGRRVRMFICYMSRDEALAAMRCPGGEAVTGIGSRI